MRKTALLTLASLAILSLAMVTANTGPMPTGQDDWVLEFSHTTPQRISVKLPGQSQPKQYWYMIYRVVNDTGRDRMLFAKVDVVAQTDAAIKRVEADMGVNPAVFEAIQAKHGKAYPFLLDPIDAIGRLLQGQDNAKTSVAIWPAIDPRADKFSVYVAGLAGKTELRANPNYDPTKPETVTKTAKDGTKVEVTVNPRFFTLRKTRKVDYVLPGDAVTRNTIQPRQTGDDWVMR